MWRAASVVIVMCAVVHATPPHHNLLENPNRDVRRIGELVNELVELVEKVAGKQIVEESNAESNDFDPVDEPALEGRGLLSGSTRFPSLLQKLSTYRPLLYQKLQNKFTTTVSPAMSTTAASGASTSMASTSMASTSQASTQASTSAMPLG